MEGWVDRTKTILRRLFNVAGGFVGIDSDGKVSAVVKHKHEPAADLADDVLAAGELAIASDTHRVYVGDGVTIGGHVVGSIHYDPVKHNYISQPGGEERGQYNVELQHRDDDMYVAYGDNSLLVGWNNYCNNNSIVVGWGNEVWAGDSSAAIVAGSGNYVYSDNALVVGSNNAVGDADGCMILADGYTPTAGAYFAHGVKELISLPTSGMPAMANRYRGEGSVLLSRFTTSATPGEMHALAGKDGSMSAWVIPQGRIFSCELNLLAVMETGAMTFLRRVAIGNRNGTTALIGSPETIGTDQGGLGLSVAIAADDATNRLVVTVTGLAGTYIHWLCKISFIEMQIEEDEWQAPE